MVRKILLAVLVILFTIDLSAASVDTVSIFSNAMHKEYKCVVIKPAGKKKETYPVVYLLHELKKYADEYKLIIVCPDGGYDSWYLDSPIDPAVRFETYISKEVPEYIDTHYSTVKNRKARAITGLSMGGHGGLFLGFRNADKFGACGSMSGGVDLRPFPKNWELKEKIGDSANYAGNWEKYSVINVIDNYPKDSISIIIDCGTEDFFYTVNHALHEKMVKLKIPHDYIERPGKHEWPYWRNAVKYQLLFFSEYFRKMKP
jgi:S-formylglutathione hydrolase FrmB